jgi:two-component system sensor histidine kinase UhpB
MLVAAIALQWLSMAIWNRQSDTQVIWLPGPLLLSALLSEPIRYWLAYDIGWLLGLGGFALGLGLPLHGMMLIYPLSLLLINAAAFAISRFRAGEPIDDFSRLLGFLVVAVALLPLAAGLSIAGLASLTPMPPMLSGPWWHVGLADALGYVLLPPAVISLTNPASSLRRDGLPNWNMLLITTVALVFLWLGWREFGEIAAVRPLLLLAPVPLAIYVALRAQIPGTSVVNLVIGIIAIQLSLSEDGPFVQGGVNHTNLSVQLWMLGMAIASLFLAAMVEQRRTTQRALRDSSSEVRELAGRLIVAQEQERARIARDLHDDINQRLAVASIRLSALRRKVDESNRNDVSQLQSELIALSEDVRHLSHDLHPSMLTQTGLTAALASLCQAQRQRSGPRIELKVSPQAKDLSEDVALCLYRAAQEGLGNALRHAEAHRIEVALQIGDEQVNLTIKDDGKGFATAAEGRRGLGWMSIDERAKRLGGSYGWQSTLGKGTELCICIPLEPYKPLHGPA